MLDGFLLIFSLALILAGAEIFTNSVEWLGKKLNLGEGAVGSVFAAVGTAMPETLVPIIAILSGGNGAGHDVGIGAILGAPFMLATLAMFVTGLAAIIKRKDNSPMRISLDVLKRDIRFFILVYAVAIVASFLPFFALKIAISVFLVASYVFYVYRTLKKSIGQYDEEDSLGPLFFQRKKSNPHLAVVLLQLAAALSIIIVGATVFVDSIESVTLALGVPVLVLSLIITPIATELPEKFNSIIWVSQGKDTLALGNISGAMVFQSSLIPVIGILLTEWKLEPIALFSAGLALAAAIYLYTGLSAKRGLKPVHLLVCNLFYVFFLVAALSGLLPV